MARKLEVIEFESLFLFSVENLQTTGLSPEKLINILVWISFLHWVSNRDLETLYYIPNYKKVSIWYGIVDIYFGMQVDKWDLLDDLLFAFAIKMISSKKYDTSRVCVHLNEFGFFGLVVPAGNFCSVSYVRVCLCVCSFVFIFPVLYNVLATFLIVLVVWFWFRYLLQSD